MTDSQPGTRTPRSERGRGWRMSLAAILMWEALFVLVDLVAVGEIDGDALYYDWGPALVIVAVLGTPVTYLLTWRRPRPFYQVTIVALTVSVLLSVLLSGPFGS